MSALLADHPLEPGYEYFANKRVPEDPDAPKGYPPGGAPYVAPGGTVRDSVMGPWSRVGARTSLSETVFGAYSYIVTDSSIAYARVG